jgi:hypothetical protein
MRLPDPRWSFGLRSFQPFSNIAEPRRLLSANPKFGSHSEQRQTDCFNNMGATKTDDQGTGASKRHSNNIERQPQATTLSDAYPHNIVVQHMMPTTVSLFITSASQPKRSFWRNCADLVPPGHCWQFSVSWSSLTNSAPSGAKSMSAPRGSAIWRMGLEWCCPR